MKKIIRIIETLKELKGCKTDGELANELGMNRAALSAHKNRGSIPYAEIISFCNNNGYPLDLILGDEQKEKLDARAEAQKRMDEAFAQYHKYLDLILTKGSSEQRKAAIGMLVVGADEIRQRGGDSSIQTSPILGEEKDETFAEYHKCLDLILANGATEIRRDTIGMLVVESDEIRQRERDTSSNETTDN